jgi:glycosyltransferase involved in cell wall biosynthesis
VRDLLVTTHTPVLRSGRALRTYGVARALAAHRPLDLLYVRFEGERPDAAFSAIEDVRMHEVTPSRGPRRALAYAGARLHRVPRKIARGVSPELASAAERLAGAAERGRVIADGPVAAAALAGLARRRPVIYNAHNFESGFRHELGGGIGGARQLRAFERGLLARADETWMVSEPDLAAAGELCPQARLRLVPNVVDVSAIEPIEPDVAARRALFVGSFAYPPNRIARRFLVDEVMPRVWAQLPAARLALAGAGSEQAPATDPRVHALGFVEDLRDVYAGASCAVVPLLVGGGTPLKLVEALAYGLPTIATRRAAAGLHVSDGVDCIIAEGAEQFADALTQVLRDGAGEIGLRGRQLAAERYSIEALSDLLAPDTTV